VIRGFRRSASGKPWRLVPSRVGAALSPGLGVLSVFIYVPGGRLPRAVGTDHAADRHRNARPAGAKWLAGVNGSEEAQALRWGDRRGMAGFRRVRRHDLR